MNARSIRSTSRRAHGFMLVELVVALAISAALMMATAAAIDASIKAYSVNQSMSESMQRGRIVLNRLVNEVRSTREHAPLDPNLRTQMSGGASVTDSGIIFFNDEGKQISYRYNQNAQQLMVSVDGGSEFVVARGVEVFTVQFRPMRSETSVRVGGPFDLLQRATITLQIKPSNLGDLRGNQEGNISLLSASVSPRANLW